MSYPRSRDRNRCRGVGGGSATLNIAFSGPTLDSRITFTRASNATYFDSTGTLQTASNNAPRFDYNPSTLALRGLLIEEQRTNLLLQSAALSTQNVTVTAVAHTLTFYGTGTITLSGAATGSLVGSGAFPTRSALTFTPTAGTLTLTVTGTVQYAQLEVGPFATSYITTTSATVTRAADSAVMTGANFSSWYNATQGTMFAEFSMPSAFTGGPSINSALSADDATTNERMQIRRADSNGLVTSIIVDNGSTVFSQSATGAVALGANVVAKGALAYALNDCNFAQNGLIGTTDTAVTIPTPTQLQIGNGAGLVPLSGHIRRIAYYPRRIPNAELQALTL